MCEYFGYQVVSLKRVRIMNLTLSGLGKGQYREITEKEWKELETAQHPQQDRCMFPGAYCVYGDHRCVSIPEIRRRIKREIHRFHITDDAYGHGKSEYEL